MRINKLIVNNTYIFYFIIFNNFITIVIDNKSKYESTNTNIPTLFLFS